MKRTTAFVLMLVLIFSLGCCAFADGFNTAALEKSELYMYNKFEKSWKIIGTYEKEYSDVLVDITVFLSNTYIDEGWGPDLRIYYFDKENNHYDTINSFRVLVDDTLFSFENFEEGGDCYVVFGGEVMQQLLNSLAEAKEVALQISHLNVHGGSYTATIDPVELEDLEELIEIGTLFEAANLWDPEVTKDLEFNDEYYKASIR